MEVIELFQGESKRITIQFIGNPNLSSATFSISVRDRSGNVIFDIADGAIDKSEAGNGLIRFYLSSDHTTRNPDTYRGQIKVYMSETNIDKSPYFKLIIKPSFV